MFHVIQKEMIWRKSQGIPEGFETLKKFKPVVAVGAEEPLGDPREMAAYIRKSILNCLRKITEFAFTDGNDGLGGVHSSVIVLLSAHASARTDQSSIPIIAAQKRPGKLSLIVPLQIAC